MRAMRDALPEAATTTWSPGATRPAAMVPAKPRKSRFGRFTHCTGKRKGFDPRSCATSTGSRCSISVGPLYQGMLPERAVTLSPKRALIGTGTMDRKPSSDGEGDVVADDAVEGVLAEIHQVDLVDRHHDVADAEQRADVGMPPRLRQHALARIDQDDGERRARGAGRHVARVLLMARAYRRR